MAMVINTNVTANRTHNTYVHNNDAMNKALTRVATGMKINSAKDGASTWAISEKMRERIRANDQANQNVQNDTALLRTAQGGIDNTISILKTIKERALNAANDSNINTDREAIATEVLELVNQIDDNAQKVKFNGRALLNGAADTSVAATTEETAEVAASSTITNPTAADVATATANAYVYKTAALYGTNGSAPAASNEKLTDLRLSGGSTQLLKAGDKITFSWKENGEEKTTSYEVTTASTLEDLSFSYSSLKFGYYSAGTTALTDKDGTAVKSVTAEPAAAVSSTANTLMAVGDKGVAITDFKVAVTYDDYGTETTRLAGQNALAFSGVESISEPDEGSHSVFAVSGLYMASSTATALTTDTQLFNLGVASNTKLFSDTASTDTYAFTVGDKTVELTGDKKVSDLIDAFKSQGVAVSLITSGTSSNLLYDTDGNVVTQGDGTGTDIANYEATKTTTDKVGALYFVGAKGEDISEFSITATASDGTTQRLVDTTYQVVNTGDKNTVAGQQFLALPAEEEAAAEESEGVTALTFYVGGEANFGIDVSINKMTAEALLGTDAKTFADMFKSKETLNIDSDDPKKNVISIIDNAIQTALNEQTKLGAMEARLGYTSDNITTMNENLEAADSAYRDSDIAKEMTNYMKYSVLAQASQYMLAQAGQNAYSVLNLLQQ